MKRKCITCGREEEKECSGNMIVTDPKGEIMNMLQKIKELENSILLTEERRKRTFNHMCKSNNWLKFHNMPKRRKPFKKQLIMLDELYRIGGNYE